MLLTAPIAQHSASNVVPIFPASTRAAVAGLDQANASIATGLQLLKPEPSPKPLELVLQDGRQMLHHDAHPVRQPHGSHHQHTKKAWRCTSVITGPSGCTDCVVRLPQTLTRSRSRSNQYLYQSGAATHQTHAPTTTCSDCVE